MNNLYEYTDKLQLTSPDSVYSEDYYLKRKEGDRLDDAYEIATTIDDFFEPESVIDFGCATGQHLKYFYDNGATIHGVEGSQTAIENAVVPEEHLEQFDLREPYTPEQEYDVAICIEVAEHISEPYADTLIDTLVNAAPIVFFTAATPGQGGTHHVNEQPRSYWISKFRQRGYTYDRKVTKKIRNNLSLDETPEVTENLFIFKLEHYK